MNGEQSELFGNSDEMKPTFLDENTAAKEQDSHAYAPLSTRMRPRSLTEVFGQEHILGPNCLLPRLIKNNQFGSLFFYGPPGCGKTTLAEVIAKETHSKFIQINAVLSNVAEMREILKWARYHKKLSPILFIDEIHRFNKSQQDLLLPDVEAGNIRLIGATTHNPSFYINPPLLSRSHLFRLEPLATDVIVRALNDALKDEGRGLGNTRVRALDDILTSIAALAQGDLRRALNSLETIVLSLPIGGEIIDEVLKTFAQERHIRYDRNEDEHYDTISAFIKSVRGCDPDAALYWMAKMLEGGEDPRFIARRLVILASEDIGLADSRGLPLAIAAFQACEYIGMPECALNLAHAVVFLATAPKSNSSYLAIKAAQEAIRNQPPQSVPLWLRDSSTKVNKAFGHGKDYLYSHDFKYNVSGQDYMLKPEQFYFPKAIGAEEPIAQRVEQLKTIKQSVQSKNKNKQ